MYFYAPLDRISSSLVARQILMMLFLSHHAPIDISAAACEVHRSRWDVVMPMIVPVEPARALAAAV